MADRLTSVAPSMVPFSEEFVADPWPLLFHLRAHDPCHYVERYAFWLITRYHDVKRLLHDSDVVTPDHRASASYTPPTDGFDRWMSDNNLLALDSEQHARLRRFATPAFTQQAIARWSGEIAVVVDAHVEPLRGRGGVIDLVREVTDPVPNEILARIAGIPLNAGDSYRLARITSTVVGANAPLASRRAQRKARAALLELATWLREIVVRRMEDPADDLISDLVRAREAGDRLSQNELVMLLTGIISAGSETTSMATLTTIRQLLGHPGLIDRLRADHSLVAAAVPELLRLGMSSAGVLPRYAVRDFELHGKQIRKGDTLMLSFGGAMSDPAIFPNPLELDIDRDTSMILNFGFGAHYCLGAHLAKAVLGTIVEKLVDVLPPHAVVLESQIQVRRLGYYPRPMSFPVDFGDR